MRVGFDIGGTFTDIIIVSRNGAVRRHKILSHVDRVADEIASFVDAQVPAERVTSFVHGTTIASNALIEGKLARAGVLTTRGFRDDLEMRGQRRPQVFDWSWERTPPLVPRELRIEIDERVRADGSVESALDEAQLDSEIRQLLDAGVDAVAVCFVNSYVNADHEERALDLLARVAPGVATTGSAALHPELGEYERWSTAVVNASLMPVIRGYLAHVRDGLARHEAQLFLMASNGGIMTAERAAQRPVTMIESGPAAGVLAAARLAAAAGLDQALSLDMGGTTAKACLIEDGRPVERASGEVGPGVTMATRVIGMGHSGAGYAVRVPSLDIVEVGAGGGSIAWIDDGGALRVGPESSGASPGPACYGRGGVEPTVTDANLVLGYLNPADIADHTVPLDRDAAVRAIEERIARPLGTTALEAAYGITRVANATMMRALRAVSTERGRDPRRFALVTFGGAGPLHAAAIAEELGIDRVVVPPYAGVFSAVGLLLADFRDDYVTTIAEPLSHVSPTAVLGHWADLERQAESDARAKGIAADSLTYEWSADLRYALQASNTTVRVERGTSAEDLAEVLSALLEDTHRRELQYVPDEEIELRSLRLRATASAPGANADTLVAPAAGPPASETAREAYFGPDEGAITCPVLNRRVFEGTRRGPLIIEEPDCTVVVPPGWSATLAGDGSLALSRAAVQGPPATGTLDAVLVEVLKNELAAVTEEMSIAVEKTGRSQHVKLGDFAATVCDARGDVIGPGKAVMLQLPHLMEVMRHARDTFAGSLEPGDVLVTNDPYTGIGHLPDVAVVTPCFWRHELVAYSIVYSHHVDIGGRFHGGMATDAEEIYEEGLRLPLVRLYRRGKANEELLSIIRANVRAADEWFGDIDAKIVGCRRGEREIARLLDKYGRAALDASCRYLLDYSEQAVRGAIRHIPDGTYEHAALFTDQAAGSDEPCEIDVRVVLTVAGDELTVDFTGTSPQVRRGVNLGFGSTQAAVLSALRGLVGQDVLLNPGFTAPIHIIAPPGCAVNAASPAPVAGRVPLSFHVTDVITRALALALPDEVPVPHEGGDLFLAHGVDSAGKPFRALDVYHGGWGARPDRDGIDGVVAMKSGGFSAKPAEVLEREFPLVVEGWGFVPDSGGPGRFRGSVSVHRSWRLLAPARVLVRTNNVAGTEGFAGGHTGAASETVLHDAAGDVSLPRRTHVTVDVPAGTTVRHRLPGAAGYGPPWERETAAVLTDVRAGKVTRDGAREAYGVVIDDTGAVDQVATEKARRRMADSASDNGEPR